MICHINFQGFPGVSNVFCFFPYNIVFVYLSLNFFELFLLHCLLANLLLKFVELVYLFDYGFPVLSVHPGTRPA